MSHIFISYTHHETDISYRNELIEQLLETKYTVDAKTLWYDKTGIEHGKLWFEEIQAALDDAILVIVIVSENSVKSHWVTYELSFAASQGIEILPIQFEKVEITRHPLNHYQIAQWDEIRNGLGQLADKYYEKFSLSQLTAFGIWRLFQPIMVYTRVCLWTYYRVRDDWKDLTGQYFNDITSLTQAEVSRIEKEMENFWLNHSHAFTRQQKIRFRFFREICSEVWQAVHVFGPVFPHPSAQERDDAAKKLETLLGELYKTELTWNGFDSFARVAAYFELPEDLFFKKHPNTRQFMDFYPSFVKKKIKELPLSHPENNTGYCLRKIIPEDAFAIIEQKVEWIRSLNLMDN